MTRRIQLAALIALVSAGLAGFAAAQEPGKLGVVNSQEILEKSVEGKRIFAQLQAADKKYTDSITKMDDQIKQLQNRLSTQRLTLTVEAAAGIQADIQKKQTDRQRAIEDAARNLRDLQAASLEKIQNELIPLIEQIRKDSGLDIVFDVAKGGTVYFSPAIDLTAEVIRRYDAIKATPAVQK